MGNKISCNSDNTLLLNKKNSDILYTYDVSIKENYIDDIKIYNTYKLYLCDNDLILENGNFKFVFLYQKIHSWIFSNKTFGIYFKQNNEKKKIIFNVENGHIIAQNLKTTIYSLLDYYESL